MKLKICELYTYKFLARDPGDPDDGYEDVAQEESDWIWGN